MVTKKIKMIDQIVKRIEIADVEERKDIIAIHIDDQLLFRENGVVCYCKHRFIRSFNMVNQTKYSIGMMLDSYLDSQILKTMDYVARLESDEDKLRFIFKNNN